MSIKKDSVVTFNYTLKDDAGEVIDSSSEGEPLAYLTGLNVTPLIFVPADFERALQVVYDDLQSKTGPSEGRSGTEASEVDVQRLRDLARLRRIRDRIDREYAAPLNVEALARDANMSARSVQTYMSPPVSDRANTHARPQPVHGIPAPSDRPP